MRHRPVDPSAVRLWDAFQGRGAVRCRHCDERVPFVICDWREGWKDCMTRVCPNCGFKAEGKLLCDAHSRKVAA